MSSNVQGITEQILRNLGAPIILAEVDQQTMIDSKSVVVDPTKPPEEQVHYRLKWIKRKDPVNDVVVERRTHLSLDNNSLAAIEGFFGSMNDFQQVLQDRQFEALRVAYTAALGFDVHDPDDVERVGAMLIGEHGPTYAGALQVALALANGVDPTQAVGLWNETMIAMREGQAEAAASLDEMLEDAAEERRQMQDMSEDDQRRLKAMKAHEVKALAALRPSEKAALVEEARKEAAETEAAEKSPSPDEPPSDSSASETSEQPEASTPPAPERLVAVPSPDASVPPLPPPTMTPDEPPSDSSASASIDENSEPLPTPMEPGTPGSDGSGSGPA